MVKQLEEPKYKFAPRNTCKRQGIRSQYSSNRFYEILGGKRRFSYVKQTLKQTCQHKSPSIGKFVPSIVRLSDLRRQVQKSMYVFFQFALAEYDQLHMIFYYYI